MMSGILLRQLETMNYYAESYKIRAEKEIPNEDLQIFFFFLIFDIFSDI